MCWDRFLGRLGQELRRGERIVRRLRCGLATLGVGRIGEKDRKQNPAAASSCCTIAGDFEASCTSTWLLGARVKATCVAVLLTVWSTAPVTGSSTSYVRYRRLDRLAGWR